MTDLLTPQNLWSKMLSYKHLLKLEHGYTIPFIVGAYYTHGFITEKDLLSSTCIEYILNNIRESATEENPIKIFDCPDLSNEPVLQYLATGLTDYEVQEQISWKSNIDKKIYWHHKETSVTDMNTLVKWLWSKTAARGGKSYGELISSKCFSCHYGRWEFYNDNEEMFIKNLSI